MWIVRAFHLVWRYYLAHLLQHIQLSFWGLLALLALCAIETGKEHMEYKE